MPESRTIFKQKGCDVFAYPSLGGIIHKLVESGIELDHLDVSRCTATRRDLISAEEDPFALRLLQIGGRWWPSNKFRRSFSSEVIPYGHHYPSDLHVGFPSAGEVLVLELYARNSPCFDVDPPERPSDLSRLSFAGSMDQRCGILREFGARSYESFEQCEILAKTLDDGVEIGKMYEKLLRKFADLDYEDEWLDTL